MPGVSEGMDPNPKREAPSLGALRQLALSHCGYQQWDAVNMVLDPRWLLDILDRLEAAEARVKELEGKPK